MVLADEIKALKIEINILKDKIKTLKQTIKVSVQQHDKFTWKKKIKTGATIRFHTGTPLVVLLNKIFNLMKLYIPHITYENGPKRAMKISKRTGRKKMPTLLNSHDKFF